MTTEPQRTYSDLPIPPGEVLAEEIAARGMTKRELAERLGIPRQTLDEIIRGGQAVTPDIAERLYAVLGIAAAFWSILETDYQLVSARERPKKALPCGRTGRAS